MSQEQVFQFCSSATLEMLTGQKASNLEELLGLIRRCPDSSIFYHTFSAFRKLREVHVPYNNDFAVWISRNLHEEGLAEKLMAIELTVYNTIKSLRSRIIEIIEGYMKENPAACQKVADEPFYLYDAIVIVYLTDKFAYGLKSFRSMLKTISLDSLYFHFIEARMRTQLHIDDFSTWIEQGLGLSLVAKKIRELDIGIHTLEELREKICAVIDEYLAQSSASEDNAPGPPTEGRIIPDTER